MAVPRFAQYLPQATPSMGGAIQQASGIASQQANLELRKAQEARLKEQAEKGPGLDRLIGPAAQAASQLAFVKSLPEGSPERAMAEKNWKIEQNAKEARAHYYEANLGLKNLPEAQKLQLMLQMQKETGAPLTDITKILSGDTSPVGTKETHDQFINTTHLPSKKDRNVANEQINQTEKILNKKVGDENARKGIAPLLDMTKIINDIDIEPVSKYTGILGRGRYYAELAKNAMNMPTSEDFKKTQTFHNVQSKLIADGMRKLLTTSVQPGYIRDMIMPLTHVDTWEHSPETAIRNFNHVREWLNDRASLFIKLANKGVPLNDQESGEIFGRPLQKGTSEQQKRYSDEDIKYTAQQEGKSEEEVRRILKSRGGQ